jgi:hypothetical protein
MVVAGLDTNAFFHGNAKGAVSSVSGVAALLGAYIALSQVRRTGHEHHPHERMILKS